MKNRLSIPHRSDHGSRLSMALVLTVTVALLGCTATNYGQLKPSAEVTSAFKSGRFPKAHNYYYYGPEARPYAVAGIHNSYTLQSKLWKPFTPRDDWGWGHKVYSKLFVYPYGAEIVDPGGKAVGVWYSVWTRTKVKFPGGEVIELYPPNTDTGSDVRVESNF